MTQPGATPTEPQRLTTAGRRHLSEMIGPDGQSLFWKPKGAGEHRVASKLHIAGLLMPSGYGVRAYVLTPTGLRVARTLLNESEHPR